MLPPGRRMQVQDVYPDSDYDMTIERPWQKVKSVWRKIMPRDINFVNKPRWGVLMSAVQNCEPEDAVIPRWKLKPKLSYYSPTPMYAVEFSPIRKPYWMTKRYTKKRLKYFYRKQMEKRMEREGYRLRFLPPATNDLLLRVGPMIIGGQHALKADQKAWAELRNTSPDDIVEAMKNQTPLRLRMNWKEVNYNWRPDWQTQAIKMMPEYLKRIDVVMELRDARLPWTTMHPDIPEWSRPKPRVIVLTRKDLVPPGALEETIRLIKASERDRGCPVVAVNALTTQDPSIEELRTELMKAGAYVNRRRKFYGINPRAIRCITLGFPNVGKSTVINKLAKRKVARKGAIAGITRKVIWHNIGGFRDTGLAFLDMPGLIPVMFSKRYTMEQGNLLCMCKLFSENEIDRELAAHALLRRMHKLQQDYPHLIEKSMWREMQRLYGLDYQAACRGEGPYLPDGQPLWNPDPFCGRLLTDFNHGFWGRVQLDIPPNFQEDRQNWLHVLNSNIASKPASLGGGEGIRGALGPPKDAALAFPLRTEPERQKVKLMDNVRNEGLFDGW